VLFTAGGHVHSGDPLAVNAANMLGKLPN